MRCGIHGHRPQLIDTVKHNRFNFHIIMNSILSIGHLLLQHMFYMTGKSLTNTVSEFERRTFMKLNQNIGTCLQP